jgi:hypothetical protein
VPWSINRSKSAVSKCSMYFNTKYSKYILKSIYRTEKIQRSSLSWPSD